MSYSEGDDSEGNCESFSVGGDEGESIDSSTDGDTKSDGDESAASESGASLSDSPWELCPELWEVKSMFCLDFLSRLMLTMFVQTE